MVSVKQQVNYYDELVFLPGTVLEESLETVDDISKLIISQICNMVLQVFIEIYETILFELQVAEM